MPKTVKFVPGMRHELWIKDTGDLEGFRVFLAGNTIDDVFEGTTKKYLLHAPAPRYSINVQFNGTDGGASAIVQFTATGKSTLASTQGTDGHDYSVEL